jgi:dTDP-4-amino-4,6-dideoxygalactose transaminase
MNVPLLDLQAQYVTLRDRIRAAVDEVFETQRFVLGPHGAALEQEIASFCGVPFAVAVASGTDALLLSLKALGVGAGDAVVTVPYTFFATAGAIVNLGARPLFVDIDPSSFNMDPDRVRDLLERECIFDRATRVLVHTSSNATVKAIVPVHLYGQCAEMDEIAALGNRYNLPVVEDSAQALGARYRDSYAGTMGSFGCFSFFPSKNLGGAGDGGMVVTSNPDLAERVRLLHVHGAATRYHHSIVGHNSRLDEIQAAVLRIKLGCLAEWNEAREKHASAYGAEFEEAGLTGMVVPPAPGANRTHIYHQYVIRAAKRDELQSFLKMRGIGTEVYYPIPLHEQECFRCLGYTQGDFPHSSDAARQTLALPVYPELSLDQRRHVVNSIADFYRTTKAL